MAGDWIPMRVDLHEDPAVITMSLELGVPVEHIVGCLHKLWGWFSMQSANGYAPVTLMFAIDEKCRLKNFAETLKGVGWLKVNGPHMVIPKWDRYMSQGGKARLLAARRMERFRARKALREQRNTSVTREEKRTSSKNPLSPKGGNGAARGRRRGTTYRAHEAARDQLVSDALVKRAREAIEAAEAAKLDAAPPPDAVLEIAKRAEATRAKSERLQLARRKK